jgi:hypothetical protein
MAVSISGNVKKESFRLEEQQERWFYYFTAPRSRKLHQLSGKRVATKNARSMTWGASLCCGSIRACEVELFKRSKYAQTERENRPLRGR